MSLKRHFAKKLNFWSILGPQGGPKRGTWKNRFVNVWPRFWRKSALRPVFTIFSIFVPIRGQILTFLDQTLQENCTVRDVCSALSGTFAWRCPGRLPGRLPGVVRDVCLALSRTFARRCPGRLPGVVRNVCPALSRTFARRCPGRLPGIVRDVCPALSGAFAWQSKQL